MLDRNRCIRRFTPKAERLLHLLPSDIGRPLADMRLGLSISDWDDLISAAIGEGRQSARELQGGDGRWYVMRTLPYQTNQGKLDGVLIVLVDVHDLKQSSVEALRKERDFVSSVLDAAPVMIWVSGPDKLCTFFNKNWLTFRGRTMDQEMGVGWVEGVHADDLERCLSVYNKAFDARDSFQMEYRLLRADGEYRWILDTGAPRFSADGSFAGYIGSCIEITEFKRNQEQMLAAQKLESLGVLAGGVAHDFHNFLGCILADAVVTMSELETDSPARDGLERIEAVAVQAAQIVRQIMDYYGQQPPELGPVDLSQLIREMVQILRACVPKAARVNVNLPASLSLPRAN